MNNEIIIYGAGGHAKVVFNLVQLAGFKVKGFIDSFTDIKTFRNHVVFNKPIDNENYIIAIGDNKARERIASLELCDMCFQKAIIHSTAVVNTSFSLGEGSIVLSNAVVNPDAIIGKHVIINTAAVIEHDCIIKDYVHVSPNATLSGAVEVGEGTHIGSGAIIIPGIKIGQWCTIGAGSVVIRDVPDYSTVVGNPARIIKTDE